MQCLNRVNVGLDYFDASLNRIGAYVIGTRAAQLAFLYALLEPVETLKKYEEAGTEFRTACPHGGDENQASRRSL